MRFFLDECVDVGVCAVLREAGHQCWSVHEARRESLDDDAQSVYADDKDAVMVTHDRAATERRRAATFGQHVHLNCPHPHAVAIVGARLDELVRMLEERGEGIYTVSQTGTMYDRGHPL